MSHPQGRVATAVLYDGDTRRSCNQAPGLSGQVADGDATWRVRFGIAEPP